jgi:cation:H+ antiporter
MFDFLDLFKILAGFTLLVVGGDLLVKIAVRFAVRFKVSPATIGLTVVAAGTSLPELVTSILAAFQGSPDIAVGNVVGSNTFNILAGVGLASIIKPSKVLKQALSIEWPFLMFASVTMYLMALNFFYSRIEGVFMVVTLAGFMFYSVKNARKLGIDVEDDEIPDSVDENNWKDIALLVSGVACLVFGADLALSGAVGLGKYFGLSERVIGLTILSAGTGLPELATSAVAAWKGRSDIAVANILGSNILNIFAIIGVTTMIKPLEVSQDLINYDILVMLGATVILLPMMIKKSKLIGRVEGGLMFVAYCFYLASLI